MLSKKIEEALNEQLNKELYSAYLYLDMATWCTSHGLLGFAHWMKMQVREEQDHAMKIYDYIEERGGQIILKTIDKPQHSCSNIKEIMEQSLEHEKYISKSINDIMGLAYEEKDYATISTLQWFVTEQVEEEASVSEICEQINLSKGEGSAIFILDRELKGREFTETN